MAVTEFGAAVTVPTPDILEQSERFAEKEAIAEGGEDLDASLAKVSAPDNEQNECGAATEALLV